VMAEGVVQNGSGHPSSLGPVMRRDVADQRMSR
jgi:hypothetical protein